MSDRPEAFWMVVGDGPTSHRHPTQLSAEAEARRLAQKCPGQWFFVTEATSAHRKVDVESVTLRDRFPLDKDIPF